ncbi:enoyl-CoA hydratase/isomerase family protein [Chitinophaga sp. Mgbs1]|uniref:3-hydroxyisobutyryl-CoA hydrolase n=1 Tax=Chitinophaga solisilvae TaxID=1233460 RepID=A0A3S1BLH9_9BACT|nr:enoyl-CoA hydratase/isomerase family protein [Chitinophaga solisilvae]
MSLILSEVINHVGYITLNSEKTLNSLSLPMIQALKTVLDDWRSNEDIACVFLQGAGEKAFCAGGDIRKLHDAIIAQRTIDPTIVPDECFNFFCQEYQVDYAIHTYPKPLIVWGHGIVMGGGIGLLAGASHRIVTEKSKLAMPEITIGLYPDVGGTWFLNKMPSAYGLYLGLTGTRLDGADCMLLGMADYYIPSSAKDAIVDSLQKTSWKGDAHQIVDDILSHFNAAVNIPNSLAAAHLTFVKQFEQVSSIREFSAILHHAPPDDEWITNGIKGFESGSPSSAHIILRQLQLGRHLSLEEVFQSELNLSCQCCLHPDFVEGVRALLVDKDLAPKWKPATVPEITTPWIDSYFSPLWANDNHPLHHLGKNYMLWQK